MEKDQHTVGTRPEAVREDLLFRPKQSNVNSMVNVNGICTAQYPSTREDAKGPVSKKKNKKKKW